MADGNQVSAFALFSPGAFAAQWDHPGQYGTTKTNTVDSQPNTKGNWSPKLTLASVQDLAGSAFPSLRRLHRRPGAGERGGRYHHCGRGQRVVLAPRELRPSSPGVFYLYNVLDSQRCRPTRRPLAWSGSTTRPAARPADCAAASDAGAITAAGFVPLAATRRAYRLRSRRGDLSGLRRHHKPLDPPTRRTKEALR